MSKFHSNSKHSWIGLVVCACNPIYVVAHTQEDKGPSTTVGKIMTPNPKKKKKANKTSLKQKVLGVWYEW
jgi:hypothetical protein